MQGRSGSQARQYVLLGALVAVLFGVGCLGSRLEDARLRSRTPAGSPMPPGMGSAQENARHRTDSGAPMPLSDDREPTPTGPRAASDSLDSVAEVSDDGEDSDYGEDSDDAEESDDDDGFGDSFDGRDSAFALYSHSMDSLDTLVTRRKTTGDTKFDSQSDSSTQGSWLYASPIGKTLSGAALRRTKAIRSFMIDGDDVANDPTCGSSDSPRGWDKVSIVNCCVNYAIRLAESPEIMRVSEGIPELCIQKPKSVKSALAKVKKMYSKQNSDTAKAKTLALVAQRAANVGIFKSFAQKRRADAGHMNSRISVTTGGVTLDFEAFSFDHMCEYSSSHGRLFYCGRGLCGPVQLDECRALEAGQELAYAAFTENETSLKARMKKEAIIWSPSDSQRGLVKRFLLANDVDLDSSPCLDPTNREEFRGSCDTHWTIQKNAGVTGTMHRGLDDDESMYLTNVYSTVMPEGRFILRHGVVQSLIQRNQWAAVVRRLVGEGKAFGTRVVNLSLVGRLRPAKEERMARAMVSNFQDMRKIMAGHDEIDPDLCPIEDGESEKSRVKRCECSRKDGESAQSQMERCSNLAAKEQAHNMNFLHFNLQSSVGTEYSTERLKSFDGEGADWRDNSADYSRMLQWLMEDMLRVAEERGTRGIQKAAQESVEELSSAVNIIGTAEVVNRAVASQVRELVLRAGNRFYSFFDDHSFSSESSPETWVSIKGVSLMLRIVAEVILPTKSTSRATEHVLLAILFRGLRANVSLNCKSGCDRTSYVHSVHTAVGVLMSQMTFDEQHVFTEAILKMDDLSRELWKIADNGFADWKRFVNALLSRDLGMNKANFQKSIVRLWSTVLVHMMEVGYRIVVHSTGVPGFKFSEGSLKANLHVPRLLPPWITVPSENSYYPVPMMVHTSTTSFKIVGGERHLTTEFRQFFQDASPYRGDG